jgi:hypothetical protein
MQGISQMPQKELNMSQECGPEHILQCFGVLWLNECWRLYSLIVRTRQTLRNCLDDSIFGLIHHEFGDALNFSMTP